MDLSGFVRRVKRRTGFGDVTVTDDMATQDVLDSLNDRQAEFWRFHDWLWSLNERSVSVVSGTSDYTLDATDGDIILIDPGASGRPLKRFTFKEYLRWHRRTDDVQDQGSVIGYIPLGRDSLDRSQFRLVHTPQAAQTITVWAKKRLSDYAQADIATNTLLAYFPKEVQGLLSQAAEADVFQVQGKHELAEVRRVRVQSKLDELVRQEEGEPDDTIRVPMPSMIRQRRRSRQGTRVA